MPDPKGPHRLKNLERQTKELSRSESLPVARVGKRECQKRGPMKGTSRKGGAHLKFGISGVLNRSRGEVSNKKPNRGDYNLVRDSCRSRANGNGTGLQEPSLT